MFGEGGEDEMVEMQGAEGGEDEQFEMGQAVGEEGEGEMSELMEEGEAEDYEQEPSE